MLKPLNMEAAFAAIAEDIELPIALLSSPDPRVRLAMVARVRQALLSANLTFRDLAERVTAARQAIMLPGETAPRTEPQATSSVASALPPRPTSYIKIDSDIPLSTEQLLHLGGYRTSPASQDEAEAGVAVPAELADPDKMDVEEELRAFGYGASSRLWFGRYGYGPVPDECETIPGESDTDAGERLALWAMAKSGQPFWEDPLTGRGHLPGVTLPGRGKVRRDGTLGPLDGVVSKA